MIEVMSPARRAIVGLAVVGVVPLLVAATPGPAPVVRASSSDSRWSDLDLNAGRVLTSREGLVSVSGTHVLRRNARGQYSVRHGSRPAVRLSDAPTPYNSIKQSGPFSLIGDTVFEPTRNNGARILFRTGSRHTDLFGDHVVWSAGGKVFTRTLKLQEPRTDVVVSKDAKGPVAVWGPRWAWLDTGGRIHVRGGRRYNRVVPAGPFAGDLRLNHATLSWLPRSGNVHLVNLDDVGTRTRTSVFGSAYAIDGDQIAGVDAGDRVQVMKLPFPVGAQPPMLIWMEQPDRVPVGQGWRPRFEVTRPLTSVELGLTGDEGRVKVTLRTSAARGTIAGLRWNGRDQDGRIAPAACYFWGLTVVAKGQSKPVHLANDAFGVSSSEPVEGGTSGSCIPGISG